jgi:hypothetical protein
MASVAGCVAVSLLLTTGGCGKECPESAVGPPMVLVVNAETQAPVCDATVEFVRDDGSSVTQITHDCSGLASAPEQWGTYDVTVVATGYDPATEQVVITTDECGAEWIEPDGPRNGYPGYADTVTIPIAQSSN